MKVSGLDVHKDTVFWSIYDGNVGGPDYTYDNNGNIEMDANKGINSISYNLLNLPQQISFGSSGGINYDYDATGIKWKKTTSNGVNLYYCGNFVYDGNGLSYILMDEGRLLPDGQGGFEYEYFLSDHLGNTRVSFKENGDTAMITQEDHYYPFGMTMAGLSYSNGVENKYLYNGKELQNDDLRGVKLDWYDYGARMYDPAIARFHTLDPLAEKYDFQSPFAYAINNPIRFIDLMGLGPGDRIKIAQSMLGTPYKQETTSALRTGSDVAALANMDCSEFLSRVMAGDRITDGVQWKTSGQMVTMFSDKEKFVQSTTPQAGDMVAWDGHVGLVESYNEETKKVTVLHETRYTKKDGTKVESAVRDVYFS